jgi:hypothetical protein
MKYAALLVCLFIATVWDIGANNGAWLRSGMDLLRSAGL